MSKRLTTPTKPRKSELSLFVERNAVLIGLAALAAVIIYARNSGADSTP